MSTYVKTEQITTTPETLPFCCLHWGVGCEKKMHIPGSLSLSLSLSPLLEKRVRGEVRGSWPSVGSNHPSCHLQPPGLPHATTSSSIILWLAPYWALHAAPAGNSSNFLVHNMIIIHYYKLYFPYINNVRRALLGTVCRACQKLLKFSCT